MPIEPSNNAPPPCTVTFHLTPKLIHLPHSTQCLALWYIKWIKICSICVLLFSTLHSLSLSLSLTIWWKLTKADLQKHCRKALISKEFRPAVLHLWAFIIYINLSLFVKILKCTLNKGRNNNKLNVLIYKKCYKRYYLDFINIFYYKILFMGVYMRTRCEHTFLFQPHQRRHCLSFWTHARTYWPSFLWTEIGESRVERERKRKISSHPNFCTPQGERESGPTTGSVVVE